LRNLLLGENNNLKNRDMHISGTLAAPKCQNKVENVTLDVTLDEMQVLNLLSNDGKLTQEEIAKLIDKSSRTVKRITDSLQEKKYIERVGGKRFGYWKVNNCSKL
jgi:ATP-dependent DNA helicase RecG